MFSQRLTQSHRRSIVFRSTVAWRFVIFAIFATWAPAVWADSATRNAEYRDQLVPLLRTYCFDCHGSDHAEGDVNLDKYESVEAVLGDRKEWMRALKQVQLGSMPPVDGPELDPQTRARMIKLIDDLANAVDCVRNPNPGKVTLRRLTRNEYRNTIRDLVGVDYEPAANFPGDDVGYGFDNIGDVLSLPPLLMEKYLDAAEQIVGQAIVTAPPGQLFETNRSGASLKGADKLAVRDSSLGIYSRGTGTLEVELPFAGEYVLTITASGDQGGDAPVKLEVISGKFQTIIDVPSKSEAEYQVPLKLGAGKREINLSFINDFYDAATKQDRNLYIHHVNLTGEERRPRFVLPLKLPESHEKLIFARPNGEVTEDQASATVLQRLASRAFRRPATQDEVKRLVALAAKVRTDGGTYDESIQVALQAILVSPHFLFKVEQPANPDASGKYPTLTQYELATRISYFLWSSMPDDEVLLLAHQGKLRDPKILRGKVGRMMQDPRINRFVDNFASQWLELRSLVDSMPDKRQFREFDDEIRDLMRRETLTFFAAVVRGNLPVTQLLEADFTYLNEKLAKYYGIRDVEGPAFRKVSLEGTGRGGLLTHGSVLTVTSNPSRTSPVKRGKWILDNLLNMPPPPAPPDIPELEKAKLVGTLRQRMEQHRTNPACAACHNMMDPLGFALENYDAVGRYRKRDGGTDIDAAGRMPDGTEFVGADGLRRVLATQRRDQFVKALIEKMMTYAIGRGVEYYDKCAVDKILSDSRANDFRFAYILAGIIESDPFQKLGERE